MIAEILFIFLAAFVMEIVDSGLGMGYGTVLTPLLLLLAFDPLMIVPAVLLSQALGGLVSSIFHHRRKNVDFKPRCTSIRFIIKKIRELGFRESFRKGFPRDFKVFILITVLGVFATILAVFIAFNISKVILKTYIGLLVFSIGIIMVSNRNFIFSWKKVLGVGVFASFNKGISGGGFGPVTTGGQIISGQGHRSAIGCTTFSEVPICLAGFLTYLILNGIQYSFVFIPLTIGAILAAPIGPRITEKASNKNLKNIIGISIIILGAWNLIGLIA